MEWVHFEHLGCIPTFKHVKAHSLCFYSFSSLVVSKLLHYSCSAGWITSLLFAVALQMQSYFWSKPQIFWYNNKEGLVLGLCMQPNDVPHLFCVQRAHHALHEQVSQSMAT